MSRAAAALAALASALATAGCGASPAVGARPGATLGPGAQPAIAVEGATVVADHVVATYRLTDRGAPITGAAAAGLKPNWTLAVLEPATATTPRAWKSLLQTGSQVVASLPPGGPGTTPLAGPQRQPGAETGGTTVELGSGRFTYTFAAALPGGYDRTWTVRVGVYLRGTPGADRTSATLDFVPAGGAPASYSPVRDENCRACHERVTMHGGYRSGTRLCITCHTWLLADPDTVDPAAMAPATAATFPNPLEMGRMIHRIHRGKKLPTLFLSSTCYDAKLAAPTPPSPCNVAALPPTLPPASVPLASPPAVPYLPGRNARGPVGTKYSVIGYMGSELVYGRIASRIDNFQPAVTVAEGVGFPQDLRNCDACHADAPDAAVIGTRDPSVDPTPVSISRRTCSGCHPDVWYGPVAAVTDLDPFHVPHPGGAQDTDANCVQCHVANPTAPNKLYAPIWEIHRPFNDRVASGSPHWSRVTARVVGVQGMKAGGNATLTFEVFDRVGTISPLNTTATEPAGPAASPVPRGMSGASTNRLYVVLSGPTRDYLTGNLPISESIPGTLTATAGVFTYTLTTPLPATASGTWALALEGRRRATPALYDAASDAFRWPYTGEGVSEYPSNLVRYVDVASGTLTTDPAAARRAVVQGARCERCHLELNLHGANRHDAEFCVLCHSPDATDWDKRPRDTRTAADAGGPGTGVVLLNTPIAADPTKRWGYATRDGLEERSIHLKTLVHRIHTGEREGAASLEGIRPFVVYAMSYTPLLPPNPYFFDDVRFPGNLANCELCHLPSTWTIESIPPDAQPTTANERGTLLHAGTAAAPATAAHTSASEPRVLPITASCLACHTSGAAVDHAAGKTAGGVEQCATCHGAFGAQSVRSVHAVP